MLAKHDKDRAMNDIRYRVPGALDSVILLELFNTFDNFLQGTNIWKQQIQFNALYGSKVGDTVFIEPDVGEIYLLMGVWDANNFQRAMTMPEPGQLMYVDIPSTDEVWTAEVAITCCDPVTRDGYPVVPGWIFAKYRQVIVNGVLARLYAQPMKPYSSDKLAIFHLRYYDSDKGRAKAEAAQQNLYSGQRWRFPQAFVTRHVQR